MMIKEDHLHYKKYIFEKNLPPKWEDIYRLTFKRLKRFYWKEKYVTNPLMAIILERVAYLNTKLQYMESSDFIIDSEDIKALLDFEKKHSTIQQELIKSLEQLMKYTEVKVVPNRVNVKVTKKQIEKASDVIRLSDRELNEQIRERISSTEVTVRGTEEKEESFPLDEGLHRTLPLDQG
jgi:hypothetical protein